MFLLFLFALSPAFLLACPVVVIILLLLLLVLPPLVVVLVLLVFGLLASLVPVLLVYSCSFCSCSRFTCISCSCFHSSSYTSL